MRRHQRNNHYKKNEKKCIQIVKMLNCDKQDFWNIIKKYKNHLKNNQENKFECNDFSKCYSKLFSHHDRTSNAEQQIEEEKVKQLYDAAVLVKMTDSRKWSYLHA